MRKASVTKIHASVAGFSRPACSLLAKSSKKLWFSACPMRASRAVSRLSRWKILCTFVRSQQIFRASQAGVRSWRASSSWMRWPRWSMKKGGTVYAYLRLRHRQAPSLIDKHKQSTPCRGVNCSGLFPLASNWRFSDEGVRTEVQLNVVALRRGRVWFFECGFNRVRQSFLCRPANCSDVARQRQIYSVLGEHHSASAPTVVRRREGIRVVRRTSCGDVRRGAIYDALCP